MARSVPLPRLRIARWFLFALVGVLLFGLMSIASSKNEKSAGKPEVSNRKRPLRESELIAQGKALPDFDVRTLWQARISESQLKSARDLRANRPGTNVQFSSSGGVAHLFKLGGYLTDAKGGLPRTDVRQFLTQNRGLLGLSQDQLTSFETVSQQRDQTSGVTHFYFQQRVRGLQVFGSVLKAHVDSAGRLISVEGNYYPAASGFNPTTETVSAKDALMAALQTTLPDMLARVASKTDYVQPSGNGNIMPVGSAYRFPSILKGESGADKLTVFDKGPFAYPIKVRQVVFPSEDGATLAWQVDVSVPSRQAAYVLLVDAKTNQLLYRRNLVRQIGTSTASVFTKNPDATPLSTQNFFGNPAFSPAGWSSGPATIGNNVQGVSATSLTGATGDFVYPFTDVWKTIGPNSFDLAGMRVRYTPTDVNATTYTTTVSTAGSTAPAANDLLPFFTNTGNGTTNLDCGGGWAANVLGATFSSFWVNTNGSISYGSGIADPFPSKMSLSNDARRTMGLWMDLDPGAGGTLTGECVAEGSGKLIRIAWNNVPQVFFGGSHTFVITVHGIGTGLDNVIDVDYGAVSTPTGMLIGLGGNTGTPFDLTTTGVVNYRDLSAATATGIPGGIAQSFPDPDLNLSITNLSYHLNAMHDFYYGLGFDETAGNFQTLNFDKGGAQFDPVQAEAQFGVFNNAFFAVAPDGTPGFTAFGLFSDVSGSCRRDSGFDASVIYHEATHGVSTRVVGGPANVNTLGSFQGGALGEGWSDAFAISVLNDPAVGAYVVCNPAGVRSAPYDASPETYNLFGNQFGAIRVGIGDLFTPEPHLDGEIWAATAWDMHVALGGTVTQKLLFEGMKFTPQEPSMVDAKDGVLIADTVQYSGAHLNTLHRIFAARGLGVSAASQAGSFDAEPLFNGWQSTVFAAFDTPLNRYANVTSTVFSENFDTGVPPWTVEGEDGAGGGPLWHLSTRKASSGTSAFYYGDETSGDYDTGFVNFGSLVSPNIVLPTIASDQALVLEWDQSRATEDPFLFDAGVVRIRDVNARTTTQVAFVQNTLTSFGVPAFQHQKVNLNAFAGKTIQIEYFTDTLDDNNNSAEGWFIDNPKITVVAPTTGGTLQFSAANYSVNEGAGPATITVNRTENTGGTVTVDYATSPGTASAGGDYTTSTGTLTFGPGVTSQSFNVPIANDTEVELTETVNLTLSAPSAGATLGTQSTAILSINDDEPGPFQFTSTSESVSESGGKVTLSVSRSGNTSLPASVDFATADGSATQKGDYTIAIGTLNFGAGEAGPKSVDVFIVDDNLVESNESFVLALDTPFGGAAPIATVFITDNDTVQPTTNPVDDSTFFVRQHYLDFLNREPDSAGLAFWVNNIESCGADAHCRAVKRVDTSAAFFLSIEFQETGGNVIRTQRVAFGKRSANAVSRAPYLQFMRDAHQIGQGVIVGQTGFEALLEANKQAYAAQVEANEFFAANFPTSLTASQYVDALFASAGVVPTPTERNAAITAFGGDGTPGRIAALRSVVDSNSVKQAELNPSFVLAEYYGYLRRNPTDPPDVDDSGYQFWLNKLTSFGGNFRAAEMVKAFITSGEYRKRFSLN